MCSRSNKGAVQTSVILVLFVCVVYGFYLYNLLQARVKFLDNKALRHQSQEQSLSSQLQAVYEDRARLEKSVQKSRNELQQVKEEKESMVQSMLLEYQEKSQSLDKEFQEFKDKNKELIDENNASKLKYDRIHKDHEELRQEHARVLAAHSNEIKEVNDKVQNYEYEREAIARHQRDLENRLTEVKGRFENLQELFKLVPAGVINFEHPGIEALDENVKALLLQRLQEEKARFARIDRQISDHKDVDGRPAVHAADAENKQPPEKKYIHDSVNDKKEVVLPESHEEVDVNKPIEQQVENVDDRQLGDTAEQFEEKISPRDVEQEIVDKDVQQNGNEEDDLKRLRENSKLQLELAQDQQADMEKILHKQRQDDPQLDPVKEGHIRMDIEEDGDDGDKYEDIDKEEEDDGNDDEGATEDVNEDGEDPDEKDDKEAYGMDNNNNKLDGEGDEAQVALPPALQEEGDDAEAVINPPAAGQDGIDSEEINGQHLYRGQEDGADDIMAYNDDNLQEEGDAGVEENDNDIGDHLNQPDHGMGEEDKVDDMGGDDDYGNEEEEEEERKLREFRNFKRVMNDKNFLVRNEVQDMIPREVNADKKEM